MSSQKGTKSNPGEYHHMTNLIDVSKVCIEGMDWATTRTFCRPILRTSSKHVLSLAHYLEDEDVRKAAMQLLAKKKLANLANSFPNWTILDGINEGNVLYKMQKELHRQNLILANLELATIIKKHHMRLLELQVQMDLQYVYYRSVYDCKKRSDLLRLINKIERSVDSEIDDQLLNLMYEKSTSISPK